MYLFLFDAVYIWSKKVKKRYQRIYVQNVTIKMILWSRHISKAQKKSKYLPLIVLFCFIA